jgi:hypothetical protein
VTALQGASGRGPWAARHPSCGAHPMQAATCGCGLCGAGLCDACFEHLIDGAPACGRCAHELATRLQRSVSLSLTLAGAAVGGAAWAYAKGHLELLFAAAAGGGGVILAAIVAIVVRSGRGVELEKRDREAALEPPIERAPLHPYRQRARHVAMALSPKISGSGTALALGASFLMAAAIFPKALDLPRWLEAEIVMGICWLVMTVVLTALLYKGYRLKDDYVFVSPFRKQPKAPQVAAQAGVTPQKRSWKSSCGDGCDPGSGCTSLDGEGFALMLAVVAIALVLGGAAWVLVEIALPIVVFAAYTLLLAAMKHVAHDRHGCEGALARSVGWGALWSALFVAPLALVVAALHFALAR